MSVDVAALAREASPALPKRRARDRRRALSVSLSLIIHGSIFFLIFSSLGHAPTEAGGEPVDGQVQAISVSLAGLKGAPHPSAALQDDALMALYAKIRVQQSQVTASDKPKRATGDIAKLFDILEPDSKSTDNGAGGAGQSQVDQGGHARAPSPDATDKTDDTARTNGTHQGASQGSASGEMLKQIMPCWMRLPNTSPVSVTLEISIDNNGMIAVPPRIIRPGTSAPDEIRLIAEARALAAVTACVPYHMAAAAGLRRTFRVELNPSTITANTKSGDVRR